MVRVKVALVSPYSLSAPGGVQGQVLGLAVALRRAGHEAVVVGPCDAPVQVEGLPDDALIGVGRSLPVPANGSVARLAPGPLVAARTVSSLARFAPDVIHLHEPLAPGPTWAALGRREPKVGTFHRAGDVRGVGLLRHPARRLASRLTVRTAVSETARRTAMSVAGGDYEIVGNGIDFERFRRRAGGGTDPRSAPTVLFVGRHEPRKGLSVLLEAFGRLGDAHGAQLWVAGEGPQTAELRQRFQALSGVQWLGRLKDDALVERLTAAHVLCAPSLGGESFGVVLLEAMAARAVVVASDIPGYTEVVSSHGVLVPPGDVAALAGALGAVVVDAASGSGCAASAQLDAIATYAEQWSMPAVTERYLAVYRQAVDEAATQPRPSGRHVSAP